MSDLIIFWHRRDLRLHDNMGLQQAYQRSSQLIGIFCFDPELLTANDVAPARVKYLLQCLADLQQSYCNVGGELWFFYGDPITTIGDLAETLNAQAVFWNRDIEPYAQRRDRAIQSALQDKGITVETFWDQLLHAPGEIVTQQQTPYHVYTPFWKNWQQQPKAKPVETIPSLKGLTVKQREAIADRGLSYIPQLKDLGLLWERELPLSPGESAAQQRLEAFAKTELWEYDSHRDYPCQNGTSFLSAALKFGAIGIRQVWQTTEKAWEHSTTDTAKKSIQAWEHSTTDTAKKSIQAWQQQLAWREFYQHALYFFPTLAQGPYRPLFQNFPWDNNLEWFQAWCAGETGYPIVDAAMRQLNTIGWMHNRCRMIVASFLTKDLIINWQWGEQYFMQKLFDGDLAANNGGWQWSASSGMDPKPLRIFNPASQAQKFDPQGDYIRYWLPELSSVETKPLLTGNISASQRQKLEYPQPIIDHQQQKQDFQDRYQKQKKL